MRIRPLFVSLFLFFLLIIDIIHSTLISTSLNEQIVKLQQSGLNIEPVKERSSFLKDSKHLTVHIDNINQLVNHLFGVDEKDPLTISLSKYEGTSLKVELFHYKYIFSNKINMRIALDKLPEQFTENSTLLTNIVAFFRENSNLLKIDFNLWNREFTMHLHKVDETILADHNISYHAKLNDLKINGIFIDDQQFHLWSTGKYFELEMLQQDMPLASFATEEISATLQRSPKIWQVDLNLGSFNMLLNFAKPTKISLFNLNATQNHSTGENISIFSKLNLGKILFQSDPYNYELHNLAYNILLENLNQKVLSEMSTLIDLTNTNPLSFIFDDLEKSLNKLLAHPVSLRIDQLKFDELILNDTNYKSASLQLFTQSNPETSPATLDFDMELSISPVLYQHFNEEVVNADLTAAFVDKSSESDSNVNFHLKLTPEGLRLNDHLLKEEYHPIQDEEEGNTTDEDTNLVEEEIHSDATHENGN